MKEIRETLNRLEKETNAEIIRLGVQGLCMRYGTEFISKIIICGKYPHICEALN